VDTGRVGAGHRGGDGRGLRVCARGREVVAGFGGFDLAIEVGEFLLALGLKLR
jgi:hypothetical protein